MNLIRRVLLLAAGVLALVIAIRFVAGPCRLVLPVTTPVNAEGIFGALVTVLLVTAARGGTGATPSKAGPRQAVALACSVVLLGVASFARSLDYSFLSDDFTVVSQAAARTQAAMLRSFTGAAAYGFYRPLGEISLALESQWAGFDPLRWRLLNLAFHAVNAGLLGWLAWRWGASRRAGFAASALFLAHGSRPETVVWVASRFDLLATIFVLAGLLLFLCARGAGAGAARAWHAAAFLCMVLGMLCKESALVFPLLLLVVAPLDRKAWRGLIPYFAGAAAVFLSRWLLFGGIGGYVLAETGQPQALSLGLAPTMKALLVRLWTVLYYPVNWSKEPGLLLQTLAIAATVCLLWMAARSRPKTPLWRPAAFAVIAVIPPLHLLAIGPDLWNSRILYLPSAGFCLLVALAADGLGRTARYTVPGVILAFHLAALQHNLDLWEHASTKVAAACEASARSLGPSNRLTAAGIPERIAGVPAFGNGFEECVELRLGRDIQTRILRDPRGASAPQGATLLLWDPAAGRLACVQGCR